MRSLGQIVSDNNAASAILAKHNLPNHFPGIGSSDFKPVERKTQEVRYTGHDPVHTGLQSHSIGGIYPWAIQGRGEGYQVAHLTDGRESPVYSRAAHANAAYDEFVKTGRWITQEEAETVTGVTGQYQRLAFNA